MGRRRTTFSVAAVVLFTILFHYIGWLSPIENFFLNKITSLTGGAFQWGISQRDDKQSQNDLKVERDKLKGELAKVKVDQVHIIQLQEENQQLRDQLNFLKETKYAYIGADVVGEDIEPLGTSIIINRGTDDGVEKDNPVIVNSGILIGKVLRAEKNRSVVRLIHDNQSKVAATVMNLDRSIGLIEGGFGISVHMNFIPQNEEIEIGEIVITSGLEPGIPSGLIVGVIEAVEKEIYQPFQRAIVTPEADLDSFSVVSVITQAGSANEQLNE